MQGRRAVLTTPFKVPYCVGSLLKNTAKNEVVNVVGQLQPVINAISRAKLNALRDLAKGINTTLSRG
jgi:hypothetical protein